MENLIDFITRNPGTFWGGLTFITIVVVLLIWASHQALQGVVGIGHWMLMFFWMGAAIPIILIVLTVAFGVLVTLRSTFPGMICASGHVWEGRGLFYAIANRDSCFGGATTPSRAQSAEPTPSISTSSQGGASEPQPLATSTITTAGGGKYVVSLAGGATTRQPQSDGVCRDGDPTVGNIGEGIAVTITAQYEAGYFFGDTNLRGRTEDGLCVHMGALAPQP